MEKKMVIGIVFVAILGIGLILSNQGLVNITSATVLGQKKCVDNNKVFELINEGCKRTYDDQECAEKGLVEIQC